MSKNQDEWLYRLEYSWSSSDQGWRTFARQFMDCDQVSLRTNVYNAINKIQSQVSDIGGSDSERACQTIQQQVSRIFDLTAKNLAYEDGSNFSAHLTSLSIGTVYLSKTEVQSIERTCIALILKSPIMSLLRILDNFCEAIAAEKQDRANGVGAWAPLARELATA